MINWLKKLSPFELLLTIMALSIVASMAVTLVVLGNIESDIFDQERKYKCDMYQLFEDTNGKHGWPRNKEVDCEFRTDDTAAAN